MKKMLNNKMIRGIICFLLLALICRLIFFIFKIERANEKSEDSNVGLVSEKFIQKKK